MVGAIVFRFKIFGKIDAWLPYDKEMGGPDFDQWHQALPHDFVQAIGASILIGDYS